MLYSPAAETRVFCATVSCHAGTAARNTLFAGRRRSITRLPSGVNRKQQRAADRTRTSTSPRVFPRVHAKNCRRDPIFPAPYYPENTQSSHFEGANPPTAVFLVMTHKIPHNSDTIFLIKPAAKMKLYMWWLKKKKKGGKKKVEKKKSSGT